MAHLVGLNEGSGDVAEAAVEDEGGFLLGGARGCAFGARGIDGGWRSGFARRSPDLAGLAEGSFEGTDERVRACHGLFLQTWLSPTAANPYVPLNRCLFHLHPGAPLTA